MRLHYIGLCKEREEHLHYCDYTASFSLFCVCVIRKTCCWEEDKENWGIYASHINHDIHRFHFSALELACITFCITLYLNRCSYKIYGELVCCWLVLFFVRLHKYETMGKWWQVKWISPDETKQRAFVKCYCSHIKCERSTNIANCSYYATILNKVLLFSKFDSKLLGFLFIFESGIDHSFFQPDWVFCLVLSSSEQRV